MSVLKNRELTVPVLLQSCWRSFKVGADKTFNWFAKKDHNPNDSLESVIILIYIKNIGSSLWFTAIVSMSTSAKLLAGHNFSPASFCSWLAYTRESCKYPSQEGASITSLYVRQVCDLCLSWCESLTWLRRSCNSVSLSPTEQCAKAMHFLFPLVVSEQSIPSKCLQRSFTRVQQKSWC